MRDITDDVPELTEGIDIPEVLHGSIARHRAHLLALVATLRQAGVDEAAILDSVDRLVASYRAELIDAVRSLMREPGDA